MEAQGRAVTSSRQLSYVKGDHVKAGGINLKGLPLAVDGADRPVGELDGLVIDLSRRSVEYLVVSTSGNPRKHLLPLDATSIDAQQRVLRVRPENIGEWQPFDASAFAHYDDEAMMSLMFGIPVPTH